MLIPESGKSPGEGHGKPIQYSCLENPMDRGGWQATDHGITRFGHDSMTNFHFYFHTLITVTYNFIVNFETGRCESSKFVL